MMGGPGRMGGRGMMGGQGMMGGDGENCPMMEQKMKMMQEKMEQMKQGGSIETNLTNAMVRERPARNLGKSGLKLWFGVP